MWMAISGADHGLVDIYSFSGMSWVTALYAFPYIFVFTSDALDRVSSEMEEAANILGCGRMHTVLRITLPLATPAILGGAIVVFLVYRGAVRHARPIIALPARNQSNDFAALAILRIPGSRRGGSGLRYPAGVDNSGAVRGATRGSWAPRLYGADR